MNQPQLFVEERKPRAVFSECELHLSCGEACSGRRYRYQLWWPTGIDNDLIALGVFANPSTATAEKPDPTVKRWINYCREWGYGWAVVGNVRAWRETKPKLVPEDPRAIGPNNDSAIAAMVGRADLVVCGWGGLGGDLGAHVLRVILRAGGKPHALKLNDDGSPTHPLYLSAKLKPFPMEEL